ncbi:hypothetical protein D3C78_1394730 [compost metagenome]
MQAKQTFDIYRGKIARHRHVRQPRCQAQIIRAQLLLPTAEHANHLRQSVELHQQVQRLVLQHHRAGDGIGQRDLSVELVGHLTIRLRGTREKDKKQQQPWEAFQHGDFR